eukprot:TRINITY_DN1893_c0_g1_i1.p1 TRINITY_DN1893_c0_g1~~TRINITY_DN1893_c0_g1_i1.p1  ORF type:complete len:628 (+),score=87.40 TRINITY_DN1893_c0_g1_i1:47-1885(+)
MQRKMNPGFRGSNGGVMVKGGGVMLKDAMVRSLQNGSLALSGRGMEEIPEGFEALDRLDYDNKNWWHECEVVKLDLSHNKLRALPEDINELPLLGDLQAVNIIENRFEELPSGLFKLPSLAKLLAGSNDLQHLPDSITTCLQLKELDLTMNPRLSKLPSAFGNLHALTSLRVSKCGLVELPTSLGGCSGLQHLVVSHNNLTSLPESIVLLSGLQTADFSCNKIGTFPTFSASSPLTVLDMKQNKLTGSPFISLQSLKELTLSFNGLSSVELTTPSLVTLDIRDNRVKTIGFVLALNSLVHLNISNNDISVLPPELGSTNLSTINLEGNPLKSIRRDILNKGTAELLKYLKSRQAEIPRGSNDVAKETVANIEASKGCVDLSKKTHVMGVLTSIPDAVFEDDSVTVLKCNNQGLTSVPRELVYLQSLAVLEICGNRVSSLPDELSRMRLSQVILKKNGMTVFPRILSSIPTLRHIDLSMNRIQEIPSLLHTSLDSLVLSDNSIVAVPAVPQCLTTLQLSSNRIATLPAGLPSALPKISTFDLSNNDLTTVPPELGTMTTLRSLSLTGNPLKTIRRTVLEKGTDALLAYLRDKMSAPASQPAAAAPSGRNIVFY